MKKNIRFALIFWVALSILTIASCRDYNEVDNNPNEKNDITFARQFDNIYYGILYKYPYWDIDTANIIGRHDYWRAKAEELDNMSSVDDEMLKMIYENMYGTMLDHHMYIMVRNLRTKNGSITVNPGLNEVKKRSDYEASLINSNHINKVIDEMVCYNRVTEKCKRIEEGKSLSLMSCLIDGDILYLYFNDFSLSDYLGKNSTEDEVKVNMVIDNYLNIISTRQDLKGVIIDVRNNSGGNARDLETVLGSLIDSPRLLGFSRQKNGMGMYDFSPFGEIFINPHERHLLNKKAVLVGLCDMGSVSCAEETSAFIKDLPNGYLIGKRTFGATCPLSNLSEIEHTGTFGSILGDHYVYLPAYLILFGEKRILYEGVGVAPNETVPFDANLFEEKREDNQLNAAIDYIHKN